MIVATTIMAIAVVGLLSGIAASTRNAARLREYGRAVQLARLRMNELLVDPRGYLCPLPREEQIRNRVSDEPRAELAAIQAELSTDEHR